MIANANSSTKNVPLGTKKLLVFSARGGMMATLFIYQVLSSVLVGV